MAVNNQSLEWIEPGDVDIPDQLLNFMPGDSFIGEMLARRGFDNLSAAMAFLYPEHFQESDPFDMLNMSKAVNLVWKSIKANEKIGIWGDFDADGQTATAILYEGLKGLDADVIYQIPVRSKESHGISVEGIRRFANLGVKMLITCDTGISEHQAIEYASTLGIQTIITDHHAIPQQLPAAAAAINSQMLPQDHPMSTLSGAGVAFKFLQALYTKCDKVKINDSILELVAIGLIADLVPLIGEARYLVQKGLRKLRSTQRPGLQAIYKIAKITPDYLSEETIRFSIAPRLNAIGRMGDATPMVDLLTTVSEARAQELVRDLESANTRRIQMTENISAAAIKQLEQEPILLSQPVIVLENEEWPTGIIGIVASQISDLYKKPVVIISTQERKAARGSARSIEGVNIIEALSDNQGYLIRFGGHPGAAGFAIDKENIPEFTRALQQTIRKQFPSGSFQPQELKIDAYVPLEIASLEGFAENLHLFSPFGPGNPPFIFAATEIQVVETIRFGKRLNHRRLTLQTKSGSKHNVIWWNGTREKMPEEIFDLAYQVTASSFQGQKQVQLIYVASRPFQEPLVNKPSKVSAPTIVDNRASPSPINEIKHLLETRHITIFGEGVLAPIPAFPIRNRLGITRCEELAILTPPASLNILKEILSKALPKKIYIFAYLSDLRKKIRFLKFLTERLLQCIQMDNGILDLEILAAETGHRQSTTLKAVEYLASKTTLQVQHLTENQIAITNFGQQNKSSHQVLEEFDRLFEETEAFRQFFLRTNLMVFLQNLEFERNREVH